MTYRHAKTLPLFLIGLLFGCASVGDPRSEARKALVHDLRKTCIEAAGGARLDAIDIYGGALSARCTTWAYQQARHAVP